MNTNAIPMEMTSVLDEERCWQAVNTRDPQANGNFVYAVKSTGIYCRPSCSSRRPRREQVLFFPHPQAAEQAGFRACRRCRPGDKSDADLQSEWVQRACRYIESNCDGPMNLSVLGAFLGLSPYHLQRTFKRVMGISPRQYAETCRVERLKTGLREGENVTQALYEAGFGSSSRLYEQSPRRLGMTPSAYRRGGVGMNIAYTVVDSPLGRLLVAGTSTGICMVSLGESDSALENALRREYPAAEIHRHDDQVAPWARVIVNYLQGQHTDLALPVDVQATAFQGRVWEALRAIPYGSTRTYRQIAQAVGQPNAARAVAHACATNPAALVIPCHRVVREDGGLGGYRWGLERKRSLLAVEQARSNSSSPVQKREKR